MACCIAAAGAAGAMPGPVACEIVARQAGALTELQGLVRADRNITVTTRMEVTSAGRAGRSVNSQGGRFALRAGQLQPVAVVAVSSGPATRVQARLAVEWDGGQASCALDE